MFESVLTRYFPQRSIESLKRFSWGQSHDTYLVNNKWVVKHYNGPKKVEHFAQAVWIAQELSWADFIPQTLEIIDKDEKIVVQEYIRGQNFPEFFYRCSQLEQLDLGKRVWELLSTLHQKTHKADSVYNSQDLFDRFSRQYADALTKHDIESHIMAKAQLCLDNFKTQEFQSEISLIHKDSHFENYILSENKIFLIDWDTSWFAPFWREAGKLVQWSLIPSQIVAEELEVFYPNGSLISRLEGIKLGYPILFSHTRYQEIEMLLMKMILAKFCSTPHGGAPDAHRVARWNYLFHVLFEERYLEKLLT